MGGSATLEMLVSSNSMNVAIVTGSAIAHRLRPGSALGTGDASALNADRAGAIAAIRSAPLTLPDATWHEGPAHKAWVSTGGGGPDRAPDWPHRRFPCARRWS